MSQKSGFLIVLNGFFIENVGHTLTKNYNGTYWSLEQKLQRNLVFVNDLLKSKGSAANCLTDRACVCCVVLGTLRNNFCSATEHSFLFTLYRSNF